MMFHRGHMFMKRRGFPGNPFGGNPFGDNPFGDGPFGGGPFGKGGPGRHRQRRGDIRLVLLELLKDKPRHGYELIKAMEERSGGFYRPSPGAVYPTLQMLEEEGSVTSEMVEDKKVYTITDAGRKVLEEQDASQEAGFGPRWGRHQGAEMEQLIDARRTVMALVESVMQAARYGSPEQIKAVQALLESTTKQVHAILAQQDKPDTV